MTARSLSLESEHSWDGLQFRLIFALGFAVSLVAAVGVRLTRRHRRGLGHRSIFAEAAEGAGTIAQIAFAG